MICIETWAELCLFTCIQSKKMKLLITSDWHLEFHRDGGDAFVDSLVEANPDVDVLIIAGDMWYAPKIEHMLPKLSNRFKHVLYVLGNHEYYNSSWSQVKRLARKLQDPSRQYQNTHLLTYDYPIKIGGQRFIGDTMWFPLDTDPFYRRRLNDFSLIGNLPPNVFTHNRYATEAFRQTIQPSDIIVTHHSPSLESVPARFKNSGLNQYFVCDMEDVIQKNQPKLWVHGHTHDSFDYQLEDTRIVCNPFGYAAHDENLGFSWTKVIEV